MIKNPFCKGVYNIHHKSEMIYEKSLFDAPGGKELERQFLCSICGFRASRKVKDSAAGFLYKDLLLKKVRSKKIIHYWEPSPEQLIQNSSEDISPAYAVIEFAEDNIQLYRYFGDHRGWSYSAMGNKPLVLDLIMKLNQWQKNTFPTT